MKIIRVDNFNREDVSDVVVAENISNKVFAEVMLKSLRDTSVRYHDPNWFVLVEDDYKLHIFTV